MLRALNQMMLSSATPGARRAHGELDTDEGKGEGEASRRRLGTSRTKFDALPLVWSPPGQLEVPLEDPADRPAKKLMHVGKEGKVVSIATGPSCCHCCVVFPG